MHPRRKILPPVVVILALAAGVWLVTEQISARELRGPMVQMLGPREFTVVWEGGVSGQAQVKVKKKGGDWTQLFKISSTEDRFVVRVDGLEPATVYQYEIQEMNGNAIAKGRARTAPGPDGSFRFLAFGDSGTGKENQYALARQMPQFKPDVVIHTGDLVTPSGAAKEYPAKFYRPYAELISNAAVYPCIGNHDWQDYKAQPLIDNFILPDNGPKNGVSERNYWFDIGPVRFICIDSNMPFSELGEQVAPWLDGVLKDAGNKWKIAFFHHPPYTASNHSPSGKILQVVTPLCDKYDVDLVMCGHTHMYERTHPLKDGKIIKDGRGVMCGHTHMYERTHPLKDGKIIKDGRGTIYMVTGSGGCNLRTPRNPIPETIMKRVSDKFGFTVVDVTPDKLSLRQITMDGSTIDTFEIKRPKPTTTVATVNE